MGVTSTYAGNLRMIQTGLLEDIARDISALAIYGLPSERFALAAKVRYITKEIVKIRVQYD